MDSNVVLFVSSRLQDAHSLARMLNEISVALVHANTLKDATKKLETGTFQAVLTEANLEDGSWLDVLSLTRTTGTELVVTHPWADAGFWAEAINMGAYDLLAQPFRGTEVRRVLAAAASSNQANTKVGAAAS